MSTDPDGLFEPSTSGGTIAVVPIRSLTNGKSRLAGAIGDQERAVLIARMMRRVVSAAASSGVVDTILVVSPDDDALQMARDLSPLIAVVRQPDDVPGLNAAITLARDWVAARRGDIMLVLSGDLPLLSAGDVCAMLREPAAVVLAPDRRDEGTNGLVLRLRADAAAADFVFRFGPSSYPHHLAEASRLGLTVATVRTEGISLDVDTPVDLDEWDACAAGNAR